MMFLHSFSSFINATEVIKLLCFPLFITLFALGIHVMSSYKLVVLLVHGFPIFLKIVKQIIKTKYYLK